MEQIFVLYTHFAVLFRYVISVSPDKRIKKGMLSSLLYKLTDVD